MSCSRLCRAIGLVVLATTDTMAAQPPGRVLDLEAWKLTLPYNSKRRAGNPDEIVQPELAAFIDLEHFYTTEAGDGVVFRAPCDGRGTENSKYPRSELREMESNGKDEISWSTDDGSSHVFEAELAVTQTPLKKEHVVCTQIHDKEDDVLMVRLEDDSLFIERRGASDVILDSEYELGDRFKLRLVAERGRIKAWHDGDQVMDWKIEAKGCYFKAGCYTQSNRKKEGRDGSYGEVIVYHLRTSHFD